MSKQNVSIMGSWTDTCFSSVPNRIGNKALKNKQLFACRLAKQVLGRLPFVRTDRSVRTVRKWNASVLRTERTGSGPGGPALGVGPASSLAPARLHASNAREF